MSYFEDVWAFHEAFGLEAREDPIDIKELHPHGPTSSSPLWRLRDKLIEEEANELADAMESDEDLVPIADAICDLIYVLCGTAVSFGIPLDECWAEVQRSNMSKLNPDGSVLERSDGKILKGENFTEPDLRKVIYGTSS
jgi:predicted HAD superfamily Cof-like phosphohydrolase